MTVMITGCTYLESVSLTNIPEERSKVVTATREKGIIFYFNFDTDFADELSADLRSQCEGGVVSGILTKFENICYVPVFCFYSVYRVTATGYCDR
jgi:hypothetical protein